MNLKLSTTLVVLFVAYSRAQLLCFYCDDCDNYTAEVEACGISRPAQTTTPVASTTTTTSTSSDPTTTPPTTTPEVPGTTTTTPLTTPGEPILTPPTLPAQITTTTTVLPTAGDPILTPPTIPNWSSSTQGDHLATPPITPLPSANVDQKNGERIVIPLEPNTSYACSMISTTVGQREIVRRGCARLANTNAQTCGNLSGGQHTRCSVCMTHLCNSSV